MKRLASRDAEETYKQKKPNKNKKKEKNLAKKMRKFKKNPEDFYSIKKKKKNA